VRGARGHHLGDSKRRGLVTGRGSRGCTARAPTRRVCTGIGYYLAPGTTVPVMDMYATTATLAVGISHARPHLPAVLGFVAERDFPAQERSWR
jgi:hypothetical protein